MYLTDEDAGAKIQRLLGDTSQRELAEAIGMSPSALSRALAGQRRFDLSELVAIAGYLGVEASDLITDDSPVFAMRSSAADPAAVAAAVEDGANLIDAYLTFRALAGR